MNRLEVISFLEGMLSTAVMVHEDGLTDQVSPDRIVFYCERQYVSKYMAEYHGKDIIPSVKGQWLPPRPIPMYWRAKR